MTSALKDIATEAKRCLVTIEEQIQNLLQQKKYKKALSLCDGIMKEQRTPRIAILKACTLKNLYRYQEAVTEIQTLEVTPDVLIEHAAILIDWCSDYQYGNCDALPCDTAKALNDAIAMCDELINMDRFKFDAIYCKASALSALGNNTESRLLLHGAIDNAPMDWQLWTEAIINLGNSYQQEGRFVESIENYIDAIKKKPNFSMGWSGLGHGLSHAFYHLHERQSCLPYMALFCFHRAVDVVDHQNIRYNEAINNGLNYVNRLFPRRP